MWTARQSLFVTVVVTWSVVSATSQPPPPNDARKPPQPTQVDIVLFDPEHQKVFDKAELYVAQKYGLKPFYNLGLGGQFGSKYDDHLNSVFEADNILELGKPKKRESSRSKILNSVFKPEKIGELSEKLEKRPDGSNKSSAIGKSIFWRRPKVDDGGRPNSRYGGPLSSQFHTVQHSNSRLNQESSAKYDEQQSSSHFGERLNSGSTNGLSGSRFSGHSSSQSNKRAKSEYDEQSSSTSHVSSGLVSGNVGHSQLGRGHDGFVDKSSSSKSRHDAEKHKFESSSLSQLSHVNEEHHDTHGYYQDGNHEDAKYSFEYAVKDDSSGNDFGHEETRDGADTKGSYYVLLPDGRKQTVTYYVDGDSGFVAEVTYDKDPDPESYGHGSYESPTTRAGDYNSGRGYSSELANGHRKIGAKTEHSRSEVHHQSSKSELEEHNSQVHQSKHHGFQGHDSRLGHGGHVSDYDRQNFDSQSFRSKQSKVEEETKSHLSSNSHDSLHHNVGHQNSGLGGGSYGGATIHSTKSFGEREQRRKSEHHLSESHSDHQSHRGHNINSNIHHPRSSHDLQPKPVGGYSSPHESKPAYGQPRPPYDHVTPSPYGQNPTLPNPSPHFPRHTTPSYDPPKYFPSTFRPRVAKW